MVKLDSSDLIGMKILLRKMINKHRIGGIHAEQTQVYRWGATKRGLKYMVNNFILIPKKSKGNMEYSVNPHHMKEANRIIYQVNDISEL